MTKEELIAFLKNKKVYVRDKSRKIQSKLFSLGFEWSLSKTCIKYLDKPFLFINNDMEISYSEDVQYFFNHKFKEITAEDILNITIDGPKYRPFKDAEECWQEMLKHQPFGWLKHIKRGYYCGLSIITDSKGFEDTFARFTFADGTPFGIKEG